MSQSKLRQVLNVFEQADRPLSIPQIARDLEISQARLDGMIQYWVRKGKILESATLTDCSTCGESGSCAFVVQMPRTYQLAREDDMTHLNVMGSACEHRQA